ncbi:macrolide family glycosyltransferase [Streptomyces sp. NBRC 109706]|uniref:macrolide family glycosyltransferase n=1 Tax=Streptomyces sp. NBRC 109706 TaxID=1550035 RepID=UPI00099E0C0C|nr:macrolide family glycosyltransferase [Streptomyces sp. NBRC 109706]
MAVIPAHGHINPSLAVVKELVARGHRVTYLSGSAVAEVVATTGAEFFSYDSVIQTTENPEGSDPFELMDVYLDDGMAMLERLREIYEDDRPDLFLYDIAGYAARILADSWGIPTLQLSPTFVVSKGQEEQMRAGHEAVRQDPRGAAHLDRFDKWLSDNGASYDPIGLMNEPDRSVVLISSVLQPLAELVDKDRYTFVGPCFGDRSHQGDWQRADRTRKLLYISLGTWVELPEGFARACLDAFRYQPDWNVVLQAGSRAEEFLAGDVPDNVEIRSWSPQFRLLAEADAFVTHGGPASVQEGIYHGVPMVAVPQANDQFTIADRLVELGVGRRLDTADVTAEALRAAVLGLLDDPGVAERLESASARMRSEGGTEKAVALIEKRLAERTP